MIEPNPEWLSGRQTVYPRKCACGRNKPDPQPKRVAPAMTPGMVYGWAKQPHCQGKCSIVHLVHQYHEDGHWWQSHWGLLTRREADDLINIRPNGPTPEDRQKAWGA